MPTTAKRSLRKQNKAVSYDSICHSCFAILADTGFDCGAAGHKHNHICESAFLAERGIFTRAEVKAPRSSPDVAAAYNRSGKTA